MDSHSDRVGRAAAEVGLRLWGDAVLLGFIGAHHDDIEDGRATFEDFRQYGIKVGGLLEVLTRREGERYLDYIARACQYPGSIVVKACDINDNMTRGGGPPGGLRKRYVKAWEMLEDAWAGFGLGDFPVEKAWRE